MGDRPNVFYGEKTMTEQAVGSIQLKSYIAPGAPATRTPCDGTEPPLRVEYGFTPRWFRERCQVDFSEHWHLDPEYRAEGLDRMRRLLRRTFPDLALSDVGPEAPPATLDAVHGGVFVARLFDIPVEYYPHNWPAAQLVFLEPDIIAKLVPPDLEHVPVFAQVLEQMDTIERISGRIEGYLNWQGVLNNAFRIRGPEILMDLVADPSLAHHLFEVVTATMIDGMQRIYARQRRSGVIVRHATVSNCLVNMVSPETYSEHLLPYDRKIREAFDLFGVHNCAWNVDPYIDAYASIPGLGYVDMGIRSNLAHARKMCPEARRAIMYTPMDLVNKSPEALRDDLVRIGREIAPCDIVLADIDHETPDERVRLFAQLCAEVSETLQA